MTYDPPQRLKGTKEGWKEGRICHEEKEGRKEAKQEKNKKQGRNGKERWKEYKDAKREE